MLNKKTIAAGFLAATTAILPVTEAFAGDFHRHRQQHRQHRNNNDGAVVGAIIGGLALGIILNEAARNNRGGQVYIQPPVGVPHYGQHQRQCINLNERLDGAIHRALRDDGYIDRQESRQINRLQGRLYENGCPRLR